MDIGKSIKKHRENKRMTIEYLAKEANIKTSFLKNIENGNYDPTIGVLIQLSQALNVSLKKLLFDEELRYKVRVDVDYGDLYENLNIHLRKINSMIKKFENQSTTSDGELWTWNALLFCSNQLTKIIKSTKSSNQFKEKIGKIQEIHNREMMNLPAESENIHDIYMKGYLIGIQRALTELNRDVKEE